MNIPKSFYLYAIIACYAVFAAAFSIALFFIAAEFAKRGRRRAFLITRWISLIALFPVALYGLAWLWATLVEPNWLQLKTVDINNPRLASAGVRIVQLSDLHIERVGFLEHRLIKAVKRLDPDVILITGDFINRRKGVAPCLDVLRQLKARYGIYAVLGNTDYYFTGEDEITRLLDSAGVKVLKHESLRLRLAEGKDLWLVGLSYKWGEFAQYGQISYLEKAFEGVPKDAPVIFMTHNPDIVDLPALAERRPDLVLAGHTHGGQFGISFIRRYSDYAERSEYMAGLFNLKGMQLYVNKGIGMKTRRIRFFCRPEVTLFRFK